MSILDELQIVTLDENAKTTSLTALRAGRALVLDFWTSKCVKCPAALAKLNEEAADMGGDVLFVSCALSQGDGNIDTVRSLLADEDWGNLTHTFMHMEAKEKAKTAFGFAAVPFYVIVSKDGAVLGKGDPKTTDYAALLAAAAAPAALCGGSVDDKTLQPMATAAHTFTLDEDF